MQPNIENSIFIAYPLFYRLINLTKKYKKIILR